MGKPLMTHCGFGSSQNHNFLKRFAAKIGYDYWWCGLESTVHRTAEQHKRASLVAIWNGKQFTSGLVANLCRVRGIPHFFFEQGMLPQSETFLVDPRGFCGDSILNGDLSWVTEADMERLYAKRLELQAQYPLRPEGFVLAPLQIHNDSQILYYSAYQNMDEFVADVEALFPQTRIVARPHPKGGKKHNFARAEEIFEGDFLSWAARASQVVGITSTALYEAAILGVPVRALGDHPLRTHPPELHDRVCAGALALTVRRDADPGPILERFGIGTHLKDNKAMNRNETSSGKSVDTLQTSKFDQAMRQLEEMQIRLPQDIDEFRELYAHVAKKLSASEAPVVFVEIGTRQGASLYMLASALPRGSAVISVDLEDAAWGRKDSGVARQAIAQSIEQDFGHTVTLIDADSQLDSTVLAVREQIENRDVDLLFIDADHSFRGSLRDWELYHPLVRHKGLVAFHDIKQCKDTPRVNVHFLWRTLKTIFPAAEYCHHPTGKMGIGVLEYLKHTEPEAGLAPLPQGVNVAATGSAPEAGAKPTP